MTGVFKMSGAFSRNKGSREERGLVQQLNEFGFSNPRRVPLSGAMRGFKFDVLAEDLLGKTVTFELKTRKKSYTWVYDLLLSPVERCNFDGIGQVAFGYDPSLVSAVGYNNIFTAITTPRLVGKFKTLYKLKGEADFLVLKDNNRKRLFLKFWFYEASKDFRCKP